MNDDKPLTKDQIAAGFEIVALVGQLVKHAPNGEIPEGELYARLMDKFSLNSFNSIISTLVKAKAIERKNHLLRWIGDKEGA